jgi:hypothetical protein
MSSEIKRCETCSGRKQVMGLGWMIKDCPGCHGIGWIKKEKYPEENSYSEIDEGLKNGEEETGIVERVTPKRGRKSKR